MAAPVAARICLKVSNRSLRSLFDLITKMLGIHFFSKNAKRPDFGAYFFAVGSEVDGGQFRRSWRPTIDVVGPEGLEPPTKRL